MVKCLLASSTMVLCCLLSFLPCHAQTPGVAETSELETAAGDLVDRLARGDFPGATGRFDDNMKKVLPPAALEQVWKSLIAQAGPYQRQLPARSGKIGPADVVYIACEFQKALLDAKVVFNSQGQVAGLFFIPHQHASASPPPAYLTSREFKETEVRVGIEPSALPGTLTRPKGPGHRPGVVLVHGSGPHDRDETIGPNKPFRDLAWGLADKGIAVLRYDKRKKVFPAPTPAVITKMTVRDETIDDALVAVEHLKATEQVDPDKIYVLGHSLGGFVAPRIAKRDERIAGLIILSGTTRPLEDVILDQFKYVISLDGKISPDERAALDALELQVARVKDPKLSVARFAARNLPLGVPVSYWRDLRTYDPVKMAKGLSQPILILQGGRDYQVTKADYDGWRKGLRSKRNVRLKLYPKLNHLFMEGQGRSTPAEYERPGHLSEQVIRDIARWILRENQESGPRSTTKEQR